MKVRFILNPVSCGEKGTRQITEAVSHVLTGVSGTFEVKQSKSKEHALELVREAVGLGYRGVFACGGDGTVNLTGSALVHTKTALGIIPMGSGNGLARALSIPLNIAQSISVLQKGRVRHIDVGMLGKRYFFSTAGIGLDAACSKRYDNWAKLYTRRGILPYIPIALIEWIFWKNKRVMVRCGDAGFMDVAPVILTVANTREFGGGAIIAPEAEPDDGLFDICVIERCGILSSLAILRKVLKGNLFEGKYVRTARAAWVSIIRDTPGPAQVDGEPFRGGKRLDFKILPKALRVWSF